MKYMWARAAVTCVVAMLVTTLTAGPSLALKDSGVQYKPCPNNNTGIVSMEFRGTGNTWGPGDWSSGVNYPMWRDTGGAYRAISDAGRTQGGGYWRIYANDTYRNLGTSCRVTG